jgi:acyl carrier protein
MPATDPKPTAEEIQSWMISQIADELEVAPSEVNVTTPFADYGMDSVAVLCIVGDLERWLKRSFEPTLLYDYTTIESLSKFLAS